MRMNARLTMAVVSRIARTLSDPIFVPVVMVINYMKTNIIVRKLSVNLS